MRKISQAAARRLQKQVRALLKMEFDRKNAWTEEWPGGVHLFTAPMCDAQKAAIRTAIKLQCPVVVTCPNADAQVYFYAMKGGRP